MKPLHKTCTKPAQNLGVCQGTVERLRKRFVEVGFDQVLERVRRQHSRPRCLDGEQEAYLVALSCSELHKAIIVGV